MNLLEELINGNEKAFEEIFKNFHHGLYHFILGKTNSHDIANEIVQITFIKLWNNRTKLKKEISLSKQIFRIAKNTFIDEYRRSNSKHNVDLDEVKEELVSLDDVEALGLKDTQQRLYQLIEAMPPMRREVFYMSRIMQFSHKEISSRLSLSSKTIENHISLAIKHLKIFFKY
jgi:RNA polymerase sigma factor, sigma-70 family